MKDVLWGLGICLAVLAWELSVYWRLKEGVDDAINENDKIDRIYRKML